MITSSRYRPEIDGLRAVSIVPVILFHAGFQEFGGGFVGVDVFFVISGYLITKIIIHDITNERFSLAKFYERRARRILPALFFVMMVCLPFAWLTLLPRDMKDFSQSVMAVSLFSSNILFYIESGYFSPAAELKPLLHTWSLAVEEQYYIIFPLMILLIWRMGNAVVATVFLAIFICSLLFADWSASNLPKAGFYLLPGRAWELIMGAAIACFLDRSATNGFSPVISNVASAAGLALIAAAVFLFDRQTPFPGLHALVPTIGAALVIIFAVRGTLAHAMLSSRVLVGIGLISYSAYLWHQPIFAFTKYTTTLEPNKILMAFLCVAVFPLAYLSWRFIEQPFRDASFIKGRGIFLSSAVAAGVLLSLGAAGQLSGGFPLRVERNQLVTQGDIESTEFNAFLAENFFRCRPEVIAAEALVEDGFLRCVQSKESDVIDVAIIGDSHAEHLQIGIAAALPERNVVYYTKDSLPLISNEEFKNVFSFVRADEHIEVVIISIHYILRIGRDVHERDFEEELRATVRALREAGKKVVLLDDNPRFYFDPYRCAYRVKPFGITTCKMVKSVFDEDRDFYHGRVVPVGEMEEVEYIDFSDLFCQDGYCSMTDGPVLQFRDANHLNIPGSLKAGAAIVQRSAYLSKLLESARTQADAPRSPSVLEE